MVRSAGLCVCVCGIWIGIKHSKSCVINTAGFTMFYTNLNSADADAKSRWTHQNTFKTRNDVKLCRKIKSWLNAIYPRKFIPINGVKKHSFGPPWLCFFSDQFSIDWIKNIKENHTHIKQLFLNNLKTHSHCLLLLHEYVNMIRWY